MPEKVRVAYEKISKRSGLMFNDDRIIVPADLRKKLLQTLHFGHAGNMKMTAEAKIFWCPPIAKDIEKRAKQCVACLGSG